MSKLMFTLAPARTDDGAFHIPTGTLVPVGIDSEADTMVTDGDAVVFAEMDPIAITELMTDKAATPAAEVVLPPSASIEFARMISSTKIIEGYDAPQPTELTATVTSVESDPVKKLDTKKPTRK